ncbi:MaoC family dehydratase [Acuticoccus sp.]|uniref:MaoC family dehydratase n=1 Tax=Acuticoccus sp. TaxID=1904378 RepID=UPI003B51ABD5
MTQTLERAASSAIELHASVGRGTSLSRWFTIDQALIDAHARISGDARVIHVDPTRAANEGPFGGTIAPGFLTLSLLPAMAAEAVPTPANVRMTLDYGFDRVRFLAPVRSGARVRGRFGLTHLDDQTVGELTLTWSVSVEVDGALKPALAATWITRQYLTVPARPVAETISRVA